MKYDNDGGEDNGSTGLALLIFSRISDKLTYPNIPFAFLIFFLLSGYFSVNVSLWINPQEPTDFYYISFCALCHCFNF